MNGHRLAEGPWRGRVVHLASRIDDRMLALLLPAIAALARSGQAQSLVLIDDAPCRTLLARLDDAVRVVPVPSLPGPLAQWRALGAAFADQFDGTPPAAVHMHGYVAGMLGERVLHDLASRVPRFHSPAGDGLMAALRPLAILARLLGRQVPSAADGVANTSAQAVAPDGTDAHSTTVPMGLDGPGRAASSGATPLAARRPLIVSASRTCDAPAAARFDQLAVLLGGDGLGLAFDWIGPLDGVAAARLRAAQVGVSDPRDEAKRAKRLAAGWVYVALGEGRGFPICLAEAMAAGLPCVALDTPAHRGLVRQGETGYLCRNQGAVIDRIAQLADSPDLRDRMGRCGRALAQARFGEVFFRDGLLVAGAAPGPAAAPPQPHLPPRAAPAAMERP